LPVIGEVFPAGHPSPEELHDQVRRGCRIAAELGCDAIKTFYTSSFADVVAGCPIPILALGAEKLPTQLDALGLARREIDGGARGVVFGRNAIQVPNPELFQQALCSVVKEGFAPGKAAELFDIRD